MSPPSAHRPPQSLRDRALERIGARDRRRRTIGVLLYTGLVLFGGMLNMGHFLFEIRNGPIEESLMAEAMIAGAIPALFMLIFYLPVPAFLDRFDPEPLWLVTLAFVWGATFASGVSAALNTAVYRAVEGWGGPESAELFAQVAAAPWVEEASKGAMIWGIFYFVRREFDGVVDGIVYGMFIALGFAAVENITYYARAAVRGREVLEETFLLRGVIAPWGHPLYTAITGIGVGIAREAERTRTKALAGVGLFLLAVALHTLWNLIPQFGFLAFSMSLVFWGLFVGTFLMIVVTLVRRKGATIRLYLEDEVALGNLTDREIARLTHPLARIVSFFQPSGPELRALYRVAARLALSKWHVERAMKRKRRTLSIEFIGPLRAEMARLKQAIARNAETKKSPRTLEG